MNRSVLAFVVAFFAFSCGSKPMVVLDDLKLGAVIDATGSNANPQWPVAIDLAAQHANAGLSKAGDFKGFRFSISHSDSTNTPSVAVKRASELIKTGVKGLITDSSGDSIATNKLNYDEDVTNDAPVPMVCQGCTAPEINDPNYVNATNAVDQAANRNGLRWFFRATMDSDPQATVLMNIAMAAATRGDVNQDGKFKFSALVTDDAYGVGFAEALKRALAAQKLTPAPVFEVITHPRQADASSYDWAGAVAKVSDDRNESSAGAVDGFPDIVFVVDFPVYAAAIQKAWVEGASPIRIVQTHNYRQDSVIAKLGDKVNGSEGTSHVLLDNGAAGTVFASDFGKLFGRRPGFRSSNSYDAAMTLMLASVHALQTNKVAKVADLTGAQIRDSMFKINDPAGDVILTGVDEFAKAVGLIQAGKPINYQGASGPMDFDANGNVNGRVARFKFQNGSFEDVETYDCVADRTVCPLAR